MYDCMYTYGEQNYPECNKWHGQEKQQYKLKDWYEIVAKFHVINSKSTPCVGVNRKSCVWMYVHSMFTVTNTLQWVIQTEICRLLLWHIQ